VVIRLLRMSRSYRTNKVRRFLVACLDFSGPRHGDPTPVRRGSHAARLSEFSAIGITNRREHDRQHQSPTPDESGDGVPGRPSANCGCVARRASRAPRSAASSMHRCAARGTSRGAAARVGQGRVVGNSRGYLAGEIDAWRRAAQPRHLDVRRRVLRKSRGRRAQGARAHSIALVGCG
jgi:hypothetical protein